LNINTVWGLMILIAFGACVAQHYLPTTTMIPARALHPGNDTLTIRITGSNKEPKSYEYTLGWDAGNIILPAESQLSKAGVGEAVAPGSQNPALKNSSQNPALKNADRPSLISVTRIGEYYLLKWDFESYGKYEVAVNGNAIARGQLVTLQAMTDAAFDYARKGFDIALGLVAAMVLFLGLMKVGEDAGIVQLVARLFHPIIRRLFPEVPKDHPANGAILMNIATSVLGLGNAATPFGIKAMQELQTLNPHPEIATDSQVMLLAYNTAGLALLPTTLLAVRKAAGCSDPFEIIGPCILTGAVSTVMAIILARGLAKMRVFSVATALAEDSDRVKSPSPVPTDAVESAGNQEVRT
jgi:spore maturation protein A